MSKLWNYRHKKIFKVSKPYILNTLVNYAKNLEIQPQKQRYKSLQIDEFWTYVGTKKNKNGFYMLIVLKAKKLWLTFLVTEVKKQLRTYMQNYPKIILS